MTTSTKARPKRKPENNAEIRVRLNAKTKDKAEKLFQRHGLSTGDGVRLLIDQAVRTKEVPRIPNAESLKAIEESLSGKGQKMTIEEFRKFLDEP
jgi:DNA-damage-inducible protein J